MAEKTVISKAGEMKSYDWKSLGFTLLTVVLGAIITFLLEQLPAIKLSDANQQMIMGFVIMVLKFAQKFLTERKYVK